LPTKQPPKLSAVTTNTIASANFFMEPPIGMSIKDKALLLIYDELRPSPVQLVRLCLVGAWIA
jgi:hypothetical protein